MKQFRSVAEVQNLDTLCLSGLHIHNCVRTWINYRNLANMNLSGPIATSIGNLTALSSM